MLKCPTVNFSEGGGLPHGTALWLLPTESRGRSMPRLP